MDLAPGDDLLTTTRSVRWRLDLGRPVPLDVMRTCLRLALQAPNGSNAQRWRWILVYYDRRRHALADLVVPCIEQSSGPTGWGASIYPAVWSLMLALRSRGLGSCIRASVRPTPPISGSVPQPAISGSARRRRYSSFRRVSPRPAWFRRLTTRVSVSGRHRAGPSMRLTAWTPGTAPWLKARASGN
jgi:hypothetical protein